jgi:hypothetical protein
LNAEPLTADKLDSYLEAAASIVEELRDFLSAHHADLIQYSINIHGRGVDTVMPESAKD